MKISWILIGILLFVLGIVFTVTVIGAIFGVPLLIIGVIVFIVGLILSIRV